MAFDIDRFVELSKAVDLSDIDWADARRVGVTEDEAQVLRYMQDTESHTIHYLRDVLTGHTARDPEVTTFLACWVYEETHHGRALDRLLVEVGEPAARQRHETVHVQQSARELLIGWGARAAANATPHFAAVHMAWGAAQEFLAAASYTQLARRSENRQLQTICRRLAKDERRHFAFYYDQAQKRLQAGGAGAQAFCALVLRRLWKPVGIGVAGTGKADFTTSYLFGDPRGQREVTSLDETMRALPGMSSWDNVGERTLEALRATYRAADPVGYARHRALDARRDREAEAVAVQAHSKVAA